MVASTEDHARDLRVFAHRRIREEAGVTNPHIELFKALIGLSLVFLSAWLTYYVDKALNRSSPVETCLYGLVALVCGFIGLAMIFIL